MSLLTNLPQEILVTILQYLSTRDLCQALQVSSHFYSVASYPLLWSRIHINKIKIKCEGARALFSIPRFSKLTVLHLPYTCIRYIVPSQNTVK